MELNIMGTRSRTGGYNASSTDGTGAGTGTRRPIAGAAPSASSRATGSSGLPPQSRDGNSPGLPPLPSGHADHGAAHGSYAHMHPLVETGTLGGAAPRVPAANGGPMLRQRSSGATAAGYSSRGAALAAASRAPGSSSVCRGQATATSGATPSIRLGGLSPPSSSPSVPAMREAPAFGRSGVGTGPRLGPGPRSGLGFAAGTRTGAAASPGRRLAGRRAPSGPQSPAALAAEARLQVESAGQDPVAAEVAAVSSSSSPGTGGRPGPPISGHTSRLQHGSSGSADAAATAPRSRMLQAADGYSGTASAAAPSRLPAGADESALFIGAGPGEGAGAGAPGSTGRHRADADPRVTGAVGSLSGLSLFGPVGIRASGSSSPAAGWGSSEAAPAPAAAASAVLLHRPPSSPGAGADSATAGVVAHQAPASSYSHRHHQFARRVSSSEAAGTGASGAAALADRSSSYSHGHSYGTPPRPPQVPGRAAVAAAASPVSASRHGNHGLRLGGDDLGAGAGGLQAQGGWRPMLAGGGRGAGSASASGYDAGRDDGAADNDSEGGSGRVTARRQQAAGYGAGVAASSGLRRGPTAAGGSGSSPARRAAGANGPAGESGSGAGMSRRSGAGAGLERRRSDTAAGGADGGDSDGDGLGAAPSHRFQQRFLQDLRRRDAEREALVRMLAGDAPHRLQQRQATERQRQQHEEEEADFLRQMEEAQLAMALSLSLLEAGALPGGMPPPDAPMRVRVEMPGGLDLGGLLLPQAMFGAAAAAAGGGNAGGGVRISVVVSDGFGAAGGGGEAGGAMSYERLVELEDVKVTTPQEVIDALPRSTYTKQAGGVDDDSRCSACAVCQLDFDEGDDLVTLPACRHAFHEPCVVQWLAGYSKKCPVCKAVVG